MAQTARDIRRRDARKLAKYGPSALGVDLRGLHKHHARGPANGNWNGGHRVRSVAKRARLKAIAAGICTRCFGAPSKAPYRQCEPCLVIGRIKHNERYARIGRAAYREKALLAKRLKAHRRPVQVIAGYVPPRGSIALAFLAHVVGPA